MARPLPRIAFFHGGGSNSAISEVQCARVAMYLKNDFELVYFDGPFKSLAGPGILPAFRDEMYRPYRTWFNPSPKDGSDTRDGSGFHSEGMLHQDGIERVRELMKRSGGTFVGAMGFSQGTRVVGGLLLDQQRRKEAGLVREDDIELQFGVLCMGSFAPMLSSISRDGLDTLGPITIPTFHLHGTNDANYSNGCKQMATYYHPDNARKLEINYHHAMPFNKQDVENFCHIVRNMLNDPHAT